MVATLLVVLAAVVASSPRARADVSLTYSAPDACPDELDVRANIEAELDGGGVSADSTTIVLASVVETERGYSARLTVILPDGTRTDIPVGFARDCTVATQALASTLGAFERGRREAAGAVTDAPSAAPPAPLPPHDNDIHLSVGVTARRFPDAAATVSAGARRRTHGLLVGGEFQYAFMEGSGDLQALDANAVDLLSETCRETGLIDVCLLVGLAVFTTNVREGYLIRSNTHGYGTAGVRGRLIVPLGRSLGLSVSCGAMVATARPHTVVNRVEVEPEAVTITADLGVIFLFRPPRR